MMGTGEDAHLEAAYEERCEISEPECEFDDIYGTYDDEE